MTSEQQTTILNVDDDEAGRYVKTRTLKNAGYHVIEAATGQEALEKVLALPDLILLDVNLPDMTGFEVCQRVKENRATARIPVLHISATMTDDQAMVTGLEGGADGYLVQPVNPDVLIATIRSLLRVRSAEEALRESEARFRLFFETLPLGLWLADTKGRLLLGNPAGQQIWGGHPRVGQEEYGIFRGWRLPGRTPVAADDWALGRAVNEGTVTERELLEIEAFDGTRKYILNWAAPVRNDAGEIVGAFVINQDITAEKLAEEAVRESEERYRTLFEHTGTAIVIIDEDNTVSLVNGEFARLSGFPREEVEGRKRWMEFVHTEDLERMQKQRQDRMKGKEWTPGSYEFRFVPRSGEVRNIFLSVNMLPGTRKTLASLIDITARKQAEEALIAKNVMLTTQQETSLDGILVVNEEGRVIHYNRRFVETWRIPEEVLATRSDEALIRSVLGLLVDPDEFLARVQYLYTHRDEKSSEEIWLKDGRVLDRYSAPMTGSDGRYFGRVWYFRDVTDAQNALHSARLNEARNRVFLQLHGMGSAAPERELMTFAMEGSLACTESLFGFLGLLNGDESVMTIHAWSRDTMEQCRVAEEPPEFRVADLGLLGECVRRREPVIINDYNAPHPAKHGYPMGHVPIRRFMMVPLMEGGRIIAAAAVANKDGDYTRDDLDILHRLYSLMWAIFARKRAEAALRESEELYRVLYSSSRDAIMTLEPPDWRFTSGNPATVEMFRTGDEATLTTRAPWEFSPEYQPDGRPSGEMAREMIGTAVREGAHFFEWTHRRLDGEDFPAEVLLSAFERGGKRVLEATVRDITGRKRAEEAVRVIARDWEATFRATRDSICLMDREMRIKRCNQETEKMLGLTSPGEIIGRHCWAVIHNTHAPVPGCPFVRARETLRRQSEEMRMGDLWIEVTSDPVLDEKGRFSGAVHFIRDVTDRKRAEEALHLANKKLHLLSSITRHDILNQLTALRGYLDLSHGVVRNPEKMEDYIRKEEKAAATIESQITFTRDYQELGASAPAWMPVRETVEKVAALLPLKGVSVDPGPADLEVLADPLFEKVCYNLIDNAFRYGGPGMTTIRFSASETGEGLLFVCEDDGAGISGEDKKRLFTRGFGKNTGLGLFLSREILSITGITITETGEQGLGARFEMLVPKGAWRFQGPATPGASP